ncbi:MAG: (Fe-S)-binding protein [Deltaproteobacteria bacterium]|nr:(Fe-S)-binding protein [Deltaproteobacteria bacterium]
MINWIEQINRCIECDECMGVCPTYRATGEYRFSPRGRLESAKRLLAEDILDESMIESFYNCPKCMACEQVCPEGIETSKIVAASRNRIVEKGRGPLEPHKKIIAGILEKGNSVNGDPSKRLDWMPEPFKPHESETLFYAGCLPSYLVKDSAVYSYLTLKRLGVDFMMLEDEGCCGTYIYESGEVEKAKDYFLKNTERFKALGIKKLILPCNGCFKCFKYFYPEVLGSIDFEVLHVVEVLYDRLKGQPDILRKVDREITYHDSCRLGRAEGITEEPREILEWCGASVKELPENRGNTPCCGSGGGIRSVFKDLSFDIAKDLLNKTPTEELVSPCPFCTFNLSYTAKKGALGKNVTYISKIIWESLK